MKTKKQIQDEAMKLCEGIGIEPEVRYLGSTVKLFFERILEIKEMENLKNDNKR